MSKSLLKDIIREMKRKWASLTIIGLILTLGIGFFVGIKITGHDMRTTGNKYFNDHHLFDSTITTSNQAITLLEQVLKFDVYGFIDDYNERYPDTTIYPVRQVDAALSIKEIEKTFRFYEYDDNQTAYSTNNDCLLSDGRFPDSNKKEIIIDNSIISFSGLRIGDKITLQDIAGIEDGDYEIVGTCNSVLYINFERGTTNVGTGSIDLFAYVPKQFITKSYPSNLRIYYKDSANYNSYSKEYNDFISNNNAITKQQILSLLIEKYPTFEYLINNTISQILIFLTRNEAVMGYSGFAEDSARIEAIGDVFPLIFFLVAALVCLNSISKLVEESRGQIGIYKALGYGKFACSLKFILLPLSSYILGVALSVVIGIYFLPSIIYNMAYRLLYNIPNLIYDFNFSYYILPLIVGLLCSVGIGILKSLTLIKSNSANLLRPKAPARGKRIFLERISFLWQRLSFLLKACFRNLFRNKARFFMTVFGIGGCTGLIITGIGLYYSINSIADVQFTQIETYETRMILNPLVSISDVDSLFDSINDPSIAEFSSIDKVVGFRMDNATYKGNSLRLIIGSSYGDINDFYHFKAKDNTKNTDYILSNEDEGVLISEKYALKHNIKVNDNIVIMYNDRQVEVTIRGIVENYVYHYIYLSEGYYKSFIKNDKVIPNNIALSYLDDSVSNKDLVSKKILELTQDNESILVISHIDLLKATFSDIISSFNIVVYVILISAILLAILVIVNLVSLNISERTKELATLKVLGFRKRELTAYVLRENIFLTLISVLVGWFFGFILHRYVTIQAEVDMAMFNRSLNPLAIIFSILITILVSIVVNFLMSRRIYKIDMSTALKSFD